MKSIQPDNKWQQLTDGTNRINLQVTAGSVLYTESDSVPVSDAPGFALHADGRIWNIGPEKSWCKSNENTPAVVVICEVAP
ncbi:hypothetical protein VQZ80_000907 [Salmonella enterica]|nr:hypothetical protein [Salmonella enterica]HCM4645477.1 hypothetical protein [Salmonella enterica subsp. enterica serovar Panama]EIG1272453.1 hypothetical protein [Salmonella enterica]EJI9985604.1 hypothetical protein [Salmonella enterica]EJJ0000961.1 hypothetical protein [Salmonella enterica]